MECPYCHNIWNRIESKAHMFCPFCQEPLIDVPETINTIDAALDFLTSQFEPGILEDKQTVLQFIDTFLPEKRRERNFLNMAYAGGLVQSVLITIDDAPEKQQAFVEQAVDQLQETYGISEEWASYIMGSVASSLGIKSRNQESSIQRQLKAENGDIQEQFALAIEYWNQEDIENYEHWINRAIENGSADAAFHYGKHLFQQQGDKEKGTQFLLSIASDGNMDAICYMAKHISTLSEGHRKKIDVIVGKIEFSHDLLSVQQLLDLTFYYEQLPDLDQAVALSEIAYGKEPAISWTRYAELLKKSSNATDQITIGKVYRQVAENGNLDAIKALAEYIENRSSSTADMNTALYWYKIAAEAGDISSQLRLAKAYETGDRVGCNLHEAAGWYELAAANGSREAYQKISYKSPDCIRRTVSLLMEDDSILECKLQGHMLYQGNDYLIISDPDSQEDIPLLYREIGTTGDFEVELLGEDEEEIILQAFRRKRHGSRL